MSVLVLNASYEVLGVTTWKRAIWLVGIGRCDLVERNPDGVITSSGGQEFPIPSVVRLREMVKAPRARVVPLTRAAVKARDRGECQVVGCQKSGSTIDHVLPKSKGGETTWENVVLMCPRHNQRKGDQSLADAGLALKRRPQPITLEIILAASGRPEWDPWLGLTAAAV